MQDLPEIPPPPIETQQPLKSREVVRSETGDKLASLKEEMPLIPINSIDALPSVSIYPPKQPTAEPELNAAQKEFAQNQTEFNQNQIELTQNEAIVQQATAIETQINERGLPRDEQELVALTDQYEQITKQLDAADLPREPDTLRQEHTSETVQQTKTSQEIDFANLEEASPQLEIRKRSQEFLNLAFPGWESSFGIVATPEDPDARGTAMQAFVKEINFQLTGEEELPPIQNAEAWKVIDRAAKLFKIGSGGYLDPALLQPESPLLREFVAANKAAILNRAIDFEANFAKVADLDSVRQKIETEKQRGQSETQLAANENQTAPAEQAA